MKTNIIKTEEGKYLLEIIAEDIFEDAALAMCKNGGETVDCVVRGIESNKEVEETISGDDVEELNDLLDDLDDEEIQNDKKIKIPNLNTRDIIYPLQPDHIPIDWDKATPRDPNPQFEGEDQDIIDKALKKLKDIIW